MNAETRIGTPMWRRRKQDDIAWARYGERCIVYHRPSGLTHMLNDAGVHLLTKVLQEAASFEQIAEAFRAGNQPIDTERFVEELQSMLLRLEYFGMVEQVDSPSQ